MFRLIQQLNLSYTQCEERFGAVTPLVGCRVTRTCHLADKRTIAMSTSEIRIVLGADEHAVMVDPRIRYRPAPVKGQKYIVVAERPMPRDKGNKG